MPVVDHLFVLMLENRSFDHFFGLSGLPGVMRPPAPPFGPGATDRASFDPGHEFVDVQRQIAGGGMTGFDPEAAKGFLPSQLPVITQLAGEHVLFDNWFSSMPGPTWPNRFFVHAASSGGLADSPSAAKAFGAVTLPAAEFRFQHGTIFDRLDAARVPWRVYHGDSMPQVLACQGMVARYLKPGSGNFRAFSGDNAGDPGFANDVMDPGYAPAYTFIEPNYAIRLIGSFRNGDSQHPKGLVSAGEALLRQVVAALQDAPIWERSALLVLWDEHGGFYDHVSPPPAVPPGDWPVNQSAGKVAFGFDALGPRVPAVLVAAGAPRGALGSTLFPGESFDHAAVVHALIENFELGLPLTARDGAASNFLSCLRAKAPAVKPVVPLAAAAAPPAPAGGTAGVGNERLDGFLEGTALIALDLDRQIAAATRRPMLALAPRRRALASPALLGASLLGREPGARPEVAQYIVDVAARVQTHLATVRRRPRPGAKPGR